MLRVVLQPISPNLEGILHFPYCVSWSFVEILAILLLLGIPNYLHNTPHIVMTWLILRYDNMKYDALTLYKEIHVQLQSMNGSKH